MAVIHGERQGAQAAQGVSSLALDRYLFPDQRAIYNSTAQFVIAICGIRWGKSRTAADILIDHAITQGHKRNPQDVNRWTVPNYKLAKIAEAEIERELPHMLVRRRNRTDHEWELVNGAQIDLRSAENPDSLLGRSHPIHVVEEAARISDDTWRNYILPRGLDVGGRFIIITTPRGKSHWTYRLYLKGLDPDEPRYQSFNRPSWTSPRITDAMIDMLADDLGGRDSLIFRQEVGAEFLDEAASVFMGHRSLAVAPRRNPEPGRHYVGGVDIAKVQDYTVIRIKGYDHATWYEERFRGQDYNVIVARIAQVSKLYNNAVMFIDSTGVGDPVHDALALKGTPVVGYKFTNESKQTLVRGLMLAVANGETRFLVDDETLLGEMDVFSYSQTSSGRIRYEAPEGYHDDAVYAEALSEYGYQQRLAGGGEILVTF